MLIHDLPRIADVCEQQLLVGLDVKQAVLDGRVANLDHVHEVGILVWRKPIGLQLAGFAVAGSADIHFDELKIAPVEPKLLNQLVNQLLVFSVVD